MKPITAVLTLRYLLEISTSSPPHFFSFYQASEFPMVCSMPYYPAPVFYNINGVMATDRIPEREPPNFRVVSTTHNHISIAAPPLTVLTTILNTNAWNTWNTFNRSASIYFKPDPAPTSHSPELSALFSRPDYISPGCKYTESVHAKGTDLSLPAPEKGKQLNNLEVTSIEEFEGKDGKKSYRVVWVVIDWLPWLIQSRRTHHFVERDGKTEYETWTEMGGLLAWVVRWTASGMFKKRFQEAFESLKVYLENRVSAENGVASTEAASG
jgi:hypothetical protein